MHLIKTIGIFVFVILLGLTAVNASGQYVCGDANSDGSLDISDAVFIINFVFIGGPAPDPNCCSPYGTVTDIDGNTYQTVQIGDTWWMAENLKVTHYRNGEEISNVTGATEWAGLLTGAYCNYNNDEGQVDVYGRLYNFYAIYDIRGVAPEGWHVPTDAEWTYLVNHLGGETVAGGKMKEAGTTHWDSPNTGATNESDFTALPAGFRGSDGAYYGMGYTARFWTSTPETTYGSWYRVLNYNSAGVDADAGSNALGYSIRCVKDQPRK